MSTARVTHELMSPEASVDENRIISDCWLDYMAAHDDSQNPAASTPAEDEEIKELVERFGKRLEGVLETQKKLRHASSQTSGSLEDPEPAEVPSKPKPRRPSRENVTIRPKRSGKPKRASPGRNPSWKFASSKLSLLDC